MTQSLFSKVHLNQLNFSNFAPPIVYLIALTLGADCEVDDSGNTNLTPFEESLFGSPNLPIAFHAEGVSTNQN